MTRRNYSAHYQIHLPIPKQWPHSSLHSGQPHSIQNKARCWRLQNINTSKVCPAAGGRTTMGSPYTAGIRNGSASGCLPKALENLTLQRLPKDASLLPAVCFGRLLPRPGCTVAKCRWEVSLLTLQALQLVLLLPYGTVTGIPHHPTDTSFWFHDILPCPWGFLDVTRVTGEHLRKKLLPLVLLPTGKQK